MTESALPAAGSRLVAGVAAVGAAVLVAAVVVSARGADAASQTTVLSTVAPGTTVVRVDGSSSPAHAGDAVPPGSTVATTVLGTVLGTGDRSVSLAAGTAVVVVDGVHQRLSRGALLVRSAGSAALSVAAAAASVTVPPKAVVRIDTDPVLRAAVYAGSAQVAAPGRRSGRTPRSLHQVQVPPGALPGAPAPLVLTPGDPWEESELPSVVSQDADLRGEAAQLRTQPDVRTRVLMGAPVEDAVAGVTDVALRTDADAERGVAYALAHVRGRFDKEVFREVRSLRGLGGSWGVVASLAGTSAADAQRFLDSTQPAPVLAAGAPAPADVLGALTSALGPVAPATRAPVATSAPTSRPTSRPMGTPRPTPRPTSPALPLPSPTGPVGTLVDTLRDLLPVLKAPAPVAARPTPSPTPLVHLDLPLGVGVRVG